MLFILAAVLLGFLLGTSHVVPPLLVPWLDRIMAAGLAVLLFSMGVRIGGDPQLLGSLPGLGVKAAVLAAGAVLGSVLVCRSSSP